MPAEKHRLILDTNLWISFLLTRKYTRLDQLLANSRAMLLFSQDGLVNREKSPWNDVGYLGRILDREEALTHPWVKDVFHITDHMVVDDKLIAEYFEQEQQPE